MLEIILSNAIVVLFALALIAWSLSEMIHNVTAGLAMTALFALGTVVNLVMIIYCMVTKGVQNEKTLLAILLFALSGCVLYFHMRLMGTMVAPVAAVCVVALQMVSNMSIMPAIHDFLPFVDIASQPWINGALVLGVLGLGISLATAILGVVSFTRTKRANDFTSERILAVNKKMPKVVSHFSWWALFVLSLSIGAYAMWCHTLFGPFYIWQPFFALVGGVWIVVFVLKDYICWR